MTTTTTSPSTETEYRDLLLGEQVMPGDQWQNPTTRVWAESHCTGKYVGGPYTKYRYRRPVQKPVEVAP